MELSRARLGRRRSRAAPRPHLGDTGAGIFVAERIDCARGAGLEKTARSGPWANKLADWYKLQIRPLRWYVDLLMGVGMEVNAWETEYLFVLRGPNPVLEWVKGTSMQPILSLLDQAEQAEFSEAYGAALRDAYPTRDDGTIYPFKRIFFVASRKT